MKKILIIGQFNDIMGSLNQHISTRFITQMCLPSLEMVKAMKKVYQPDLILISLLGIDEFDTGILEYYKIRNSWTPTIFLGTAEECNYYQKDYNGSQYEYVVRPTTLGTLLQRCELMLKKIDNVEEPYEKKVSSKDTTQAKKCILAVDDSGMFLRNIKTMLESQYDIVVANSGETAITQAKKKQPDLILLDYEMPGWDGKKTFEVIKADEELQDIPVVFLTSVSDRMHISSVLALKPAGYLLKPVEQQRLLDTVHEVLIEI